MGDHPLDYVQMKNKIDLTQRAQVEQLRLTYGHELSAHAFLSLYLWQKPLGLSLYVEEEMYSVKISKLGNNTWFFPCGSETAVLSFLH